jgi:hypothetical protein
MADTNKGDKILKGIVTTLLLLTIGAYGALG